MMQYWPMEARKGKHEEQRNKEDGNNLYATKLLKQMEVSTTTNISKAQLNTNHIKSVDRENSQTLDNPSIPVPYYLSEFRFMINENGITQNERIFS